MHRFQNVLVSVLEVFLDPEARFSIWRRMNRMTIIFTAIQFVQQILRFQFYQRDDYSIIRVDDADLKFDGWMEM